MISAAEQAEYFALLREKLAETQSDYDLLQEICRDGEQPTEEAFKLVSAKGQLLGISMVNASRAGLLDRDIASVTKDFPMVMLIIVNAIAPF